MRKTYALMKKFIPIIMCGLVPTIVFGILSFSICYNPETYSLKIPTAVTCIFLALIVIFIALSAYVAVKCDGVKVTKIRKCSFSKFASYLAAVSTLIGFIYDLTVIIEDPHSFGIFRTIRFILSLALFAYFVISALPKQIKHKKTVFPRYLTRTLSVCTVFWGLCGIFSIYFYDKLLTSEISRISQILIYVFITLFFLFEAEAEHLEPKYRPYIFSALALGILVCAFPVPMILIPSVQRFSAMELSYPISIGIYAVSRIVSLMKTMKRSIDERENLEAAKYSDDYEEYEEPDEDKKAEKHSEDNKAEKKGNIE